MIATPTAFYEKLSFWQERLARLSTNDSNTSPDLSHGTSQWESESDLLLKKE